MFFCHLRALLILLLCFFIAESGFAQHKKPQPKKVKIQWKRKGRIGLTDKSCFTFPNGFVVVSSSEKKLHVDYYADSTKPVKRFVKTFKSDITGMVQVSRAGEQIVVAVMEWDSAYRFMHFNSKAELTQTMYVSRKEFRSRVNRKTQDRYTDNYYPVSVLSSWVFDEKNYLTGTSYYEVGLERVKKKKQTKQVVRCMVWNNDSLRPGYRIKWSTPIPDLQITTYRFFHFGKGRVMLYVTGANSKNGRKESHLVRFNDETGEVIFDEFINPIPGAHFMLSNGAAHAQNDQFAFAGNFRATWSSDTPDGPTGVFLMAINASNQISYEFLPYPDKPAGARKNFKSNPVFVFHALYFHPQGRVMAVGELFSLVNGGMIRNILLPYHRPRFRVHQTDGTYNVLPEGAEVISFNPDLSSISRTDLQEFNILQRKRIHWYQVSDPNQFFLGQNDNKSPFAMQPPALTDSVTLSIVMINPNEGRKFLRKKQNMGVYRLEATPSLANIEQIGKISHHRKFKNIICYQGMASSKKRLWVIEPIPALPSGKFELRWGFLPSWPKKVRFKAQMQLYVPKPPAPGQKPETTEELKQEEIENIIVDPDSGN